MSYQHYLEHRRKHQRCPVCKIKIYLNDKYHHECPIHGEYKLDHATGKLEKVIN